MSTPTTTKPDLTTPSGLHAYLLTHHPTTPPKSITLLTGGTANYVYRVLSPHPNNASPKTVIYKHAAPHLHSNLDFAFDPRRMEYEDLALRIVPGFLDDVGSDTDSADRKAHAADEEEEGMSVRARAVQSYSYDGDAKLLCLSDGGSQNVKDAYQDLKKGEVRKIGEELGRWLAVLHSSSSASSPSLSLSLDEKHEMNDVGSRGRENNPIAVAIYRYSYTNLHHALAEYDIPGGQEVAQRVDETFGALLQIEDECLCHGDFWTGNVLVEKKANRATDAGKVGNPQTRIDLTVVDWEMVRLGTSATDVAQSAPKPSCSIDSAAVKGCGLRSWRPTCATGSLLRLKQGC
ncbi:uncharacterized protein EI97DRAFT_435671 [Westerdykella ornata]|uniref:Aminoglycoside phosphotransferase domain-containing protein n=1 Tax=Westerdykella ornata TaxID=318751 RepID=A0A6A6JAX2_WESOR|nr:uncharacterized protein EI97DRAFT_435671 [Westerdykella ornata]KAF2273751.1 hypothetical protein EI97DRAFT_435671 [Westerdykella ornata]